MDNDREVNGGRSPLRLADPAGLPEVERLCAEVSGELREILKTLYTSRQRIAAAAWHIVHPDHLSAEEAVELARGLARTAGPEFEAEIEEFLASGHCTRPLARPADVVSLHREQA